MKSNIPGELLCGEHGHLQNQGECGSGSLQSPDQNPPSMGRKDLAPGFKSTNREQFQLQETGFRVMRERTTGISLLFLSKFSQA